MAKQTLKSTTPTVTTDPASATDPKFISQINAGGEVYDIATHHSIKFFDGQNDTTGVTWNGITDLEVVIPTITDLVTDPVKLVGTVGEDGKLPDGLTPDTGNLLYITNDCTFQGIACEAGDMAIYVKGDGEDSGAWHVVTGENQVTILGTFSDNKSTFTLTGTAQDVLTVEGKTLSLKIDYADVRSNMSVTMNGENTYEVKCGTIAVSKGYVSLSKANDSKLDISKSVSIDLPTALTSGDVTISDKVFVSGDFTWDAGALPTLKKNDSTISVTATHNMSITKTDDNANGQYVTGIDGAVKSVSLSSSDTSSSGSYKYMTGISRADGSTFLSGIHTATSADNDKTPDFIIPGKASVNNKTFVSGVSTTEATNGDFVSSVSVGAVTVDASGSSFISGLDTESDDASKAVITNVSIGTAVQDSSAEWFYSGLGTEGDSGDLVSSVTAISSATLVSAASSTFASSAMTTASVVNHVLTFGTGSFMTPVSVSTSNAVVKKKSFTKTGVKLSGFSVKSADFLTAGISQADTTVSYKSLLTGDVTLSFDADTKYFFDKGVADSYTEVASYLKLDSSSANITKGTPTLSNTAITASIPANSVVVSFDNAGTLPSWVAGAPSGTISGTVGTSLTTTSTSWLGIDPDKKSMTVAGGYTLTSASGDGAIEIGLAGNYDVDSAFITIASGTYVTDVNVSGTAISKG